MSARSLDEILGRPRPTPTAVAAPANERAMLDDLVAYTWPEELPGHLSVSSMGTYYRCREQFRIRYVEGRKEPPKGYFLWGTADHRAIEENFRGKITTEMDMPVRAVQELFAADLEERVGKAGEVDWGGSSLAEVKDRGVRLVAKYRVDVAPGVMPAAVEEEFTIPVDGLSVPVVGRIDVRKRDGVVIDRKTTSKKFTVVEGAYRAQARVYQLVHPAPVEVHVSTKTKEPAVYTPAEEKGLLVPRAENVDVLTRDWIRATARAIMSDYLSFGPEGPWPGSHTQNHPPCGWCGFAHRCRWRLGAA